MNEQLFVKTVKSILDSGGKIICSNHAIGRMAKRKIRIADIEEILHNPTYVKKAEPSESVPESINYRVMGKFDWSVVVAFIDLDKLVVVTVID